MMKVVSGVALGLGGITAALATLLTGTLPSLFTSDPEVWAAMRLVSPLCGLNLVLYGLIATLQVYSVLGVWVVDDDSSLQTKCPILNSTFHFLELFEGAWHV